MDPFKRLPSELVVEILSLTADFAGVEGLLLASPWVNSVFQEQPARVTLDLIASNSITAMPEIQQLIRNIAITYNPSIHCSCLEEHLQLCTTSDNNNTSGPDSTLLPEQMTTSEIFAIIHIAANTQRLACMCLQTMHQNFISAVAESRGSEAAQKAAQPVMWIEEYRVYWSLWHLQHYSSLRKTAQHRWGWSKESIRKLGDTYVTWNNLSFRISEQIWTVAANVADLGLRPLYGHSAKENMNEEEEDKEGLEEKLDEEESSKPAWTFPHETPIPFFPSLDLPPQNHDYPNWSPPPVSDEDSQVNQCWNLAPRRRLEATASATMIRAYTGMISRRPDLKQGARDMREARPFRRLGVTLWNDWRMYSVGLHSSTSREKMVPTPDVGFVDGNAGNLTIWDIIPRWLGLVGKPPLVRQYE